MESLSAALFLLAFIAVAAAIAAPISLLAGVAVYRFQKFKQKPDIFLTALVTGIIYEVLILFACVALIIWNPRFG